MRVGSFKLRDGLGGRWWRACGARRNRKALLLQVADEALPALLGEEVGGVDLLEADAGGELVGTGAAEHHELRLLHDGFGEGDGILGPRDAGDGSGFHGLAVHDGGVELVLAVGGEDGAFAGVEERIVLEHVEAGFDGVHC